MALEKSETIARLDVSTAFLHAETRDDVHVKLDPEHEKRTSRIFNQLAVEESVERTEPCEDV